MGRTLLFFLVTLLIVPSAWAQSEDPIITDRPDFTESPVSVSPGTIQIELGATAFDYDAGSLWNAGETLVRYGLFNKVEMRLQLPSAIGGDDSDSGLSDSGFGVKIELGSFAQRVEMALIASTTLPTGADDFTSDAVDPGLILAAGMMLNDRVSLGSQLSASFDEQGDERVLNSGFTIVSGFPLSSSVGGFTELAFDFPDGLDTQVTFHTGLVLAFDSRSQLDIHGGFGLTDNTPDSFLGIGFSIKR